MMAFIEQEASEKAEEIDAKVNKCFVMRNFRMKMLTMAAQGTYAMK